MQGHGVGQHAAHATDLNIGVGIPGSRRSHSGFQQQTVVAPIHLDVQKPLFKLAAGFLAEHGLDVEAAGPRQGIVADDQAVPSPVERDTTVVQALKHPWLSDYADRRRKTLERRQVPNGG